jgi:hypothetical protein
MTALLIFSYYGEHFLSMLVAVDTCRNLLPRRLAAGLTQNRRRDATYPVCYQQTTV